MHGVIGTVLCSKWHFQLCSPYYSHVSFCCYAKFNFFLSLKQALKSVVLYVILSPYDNEQSDLVHRISSDKKLEDIPKYKYVECSILSIVIIYSEACLVMLKTGKLKVLLKILLAA